MSQPSLTVFLETQKRTELAICGYIHDQKRNVPTDIAKVIGDQFIEYYWKSQTLFDCNYNEMKDIIVSCMRTLSIKHPSIDMEKLSLVLKMKKINGREFCKLSIYEWVFLLYNDDICPTIAAAKAWKMIHRFEITRIKSGSSVYLPLPYVYS